MWKTVGNSLISLVLRAENVLQQQTRNTYVMKRRYPTRLHKIGALPKRLKPKNYIYEVVQNTDIEKQPNLELILTKYVEGIGEVGDRVSVRPYVGYNKLLLPGLAVYASPENIVKYKNYVENKVEVEHSSPSAQSICNQLANMTLSVVMNKDTPWVLKAWHVKASFRKSGIRVPEEAITMPSKAIEGPNLDLENKEFFVGVTVNNHEKVNIRCIVHHWSTDIVDRIPHEHDFWKRKLEPLFPEDAGILAKLPANKKLES